MEQRPLLLKPMISVSSVVGQAENDDAVYEKFLTVKDNDNTYHSNIVTFTTPILYYHYR